MTDLSGICLILLLVRYLIIMISYLIIPMKSEVDTRKQNRKEENKRDIIEN